MPRTLSPEEAQRAGLKEVRCRRRTCGKFLTYMSADGTELIVNEGTSVKRGRVGLTCVCGYITPWRSSTNVARKPAKIDPPINFS